MREDKNAEFFVRYDVFVEQGTHEGALFTANAKRLLVVRKHVELISGERAVFVQHRPKHFLGNKFLERFRRRATVISRLTHEMILRLFDKIALMIVAPTP